MPKRGYMKYLFIFLTLPFFLAATQDEFNENSDFYDYQRYHFNSLDPLDRTLIVVDGHYYRVVMMEHCQDCPCSY